MNGNRIEQNMQVQEAYERARAVLSEVRTVIKGKDDCVEKAFCAILAGGHILIEDVPGVGKTTLAVAFSRAMALKAQRVQFTPDVQPSDILGFSMYHKDTGTFSYHPSVRIDLEYPDFAKWVESNGATNNDWYLYYQSSKE